MNIFIEKCQFQAKNISQNEDLRFLQLKNNKSQSQNQNLPSDSSSSDLGLGIGVSLGLIILVLLLLYFAYQNNLEQKKKQKIVLQEAEVKLKRSLQKIVKDYEDFQIESENVRRKLVGWESKNIYELKKNYLICVDQIEQQEKRQKAQDLQEKMVKGFQNLLLQEAQKIQQKQKKKKKLSKKPTELEFVNKINQQKTGNQNEKKSDHIRLYGETLQDRKKNYERQMLACGIKIGKKLDVFIEKLREEFRQEEILQQELQQEKMEIPLDKKKVDILIHDNLTSSEQQSQEDQFKSIQQNSDQNQAVSSFQKNSFQSSFNNNNLDLSKNNQKQQSINQESEIVNESSQNKESEKQEELLDERTAIDKYIDKFWKINIKKDEIQLDENNQDEKKEEEEEKDLQQIDHEVHLLIHKLLLMADDDPAEVFSVHLKQNLINHQEQILSVKEAIKPGFFAIHFKPFTKEMLKEYFKKIHNEETVNNDVEKEIIQQKIYRKIQRGIDLNLNVNQDLQKIINDQETDFMKFKIQNQLELARSGIRKQISIKNQFFRITNEANDDEENQPKFFKSTKFKISPQNSMSDEENNYFNLNKRSSLQEKNMKSTVNFQKKSTLIPQLDKDMERNKQMHFSSISIKDELYSKIGHLYQDDVQTVEWINKNSQYRNSIANIIDRKLDFEIKTSPQNSERKKVNNSAEIQDENPLNDTGNHESQVTSYNLRKQDNTYYLNIQERKDNIQVGEGQLKDIKTNGLKIQINKIQPIEE